MTGEEERRRMCVADGRRVYRLLFAPRSIVVIGGGNDPFKPGGSVVRNIKIHGFKGDLWVVNPKAPAVLGLPVFASVSELPSAPDLAIIAIPASAVVRTLEDLARKGTGAAIILSSGFGEKDDRGKQIEARMLEIARESGMALVGPNCSGFLTQTYKGKFAGIIPDLEGRAVDFISGSGAIVDYVMEQACSRGLSFGTVVNLGNSIQLGVEDLLSIFDENHEPDHAPILLLYMESMRSPCRLLRHARSLARKGCVLVGIKAGVSEAGQRAAASHTGAMATSDIAVEALFEKAGMIRVRSKSELIDVACVLRATGGLPLGNRVCVVTDAGGPGVMLADELSRQGMELPLLSPETREKLRYVLPPESSVSNPIDCLPSRTGRQIEAVLGILAKMERDSIDIILLVIGDSRMSDNQEIFEAILRGAPKWPIPVIPVLSAAISSRQAIERFRATGNVFFPDEVLLATALGKVSRCHRPAEAIEELSDFDGHAIEALLSGLSGELPSGIVSRVLEAAGFRIPLEGPVRRPDDLPAVCRSLGFPLALKVAGISHKTDVGGVKTDIRGIQEAESAWHDLMAIPGAGGVLAQRMVEGIEVILGATREEGFGHLILFGLGGIYAEILKDFRFALAPLGKEESLRLMRGIRSAAVFDGVRGMPGLSRDGLSDYLMRLSRLVTDFPRIAEIDLNPVKGFDSNLWVVDARMSLREIH